MITGILALIFLVPLIAGARNLEWGVVAVAAVIILLLLGLGSVGREQDRAYLNAMRYWANGGPDRKIRRK